MTIAEYAPPSKIDGTPVTAYTDRPLEHEGETWVTLVPDEEGDDRLWEWSLSTGRLVAVRG